MTRDQFKKKHGAEWSKLVHTEMYQDAIAAVETEAPELQVLNISQPDVKLFSEQIVARQQGFLSYANALSHLHEQPKEELEDLGAPDYPDPLREIEAVEKKKKKA